MAANYVLLASQTVGEAGASSITFSNIPQTGYTDLKLECATRMNQVLGYGLFINPNGSSANATAKYIQAHPTGVGSYGATNRIMINNGSSGTNTTASTFGSSTVYIPNYTSANYKTFSSDDVAENNSNTSNLSYIHLAASLWSSTAAITSLQIIPQSGASFVQYSSFYLYGISASGVTPVIAPLATGGNVTNDGTYWYHSFLASGTFTPLKTLSCDYLVVAGGGGGGVSGDFNSGGGGGAGGFRTATAQSITSATTVTVGAGGAGGANGVNSVFSTTTSTGGGKGADSTAAGTGGSGGGGNGSTYSAYAAGNTPSTSPVQGYRGGNGLTTPQALGGGGGGAGAVGGAASIITYGNGGNGGIGSSTAISGGATTGLGQLSGGTYYFAGGGGGKEATPTDASGLGGLGGGGRGYDSNTTTDSVAGTANTGGGGGGAGKVGGAGKAGGSGIVIIRYAMV